MSASTPEPSFQPSGQDQQGLTQGRSWSPPPSYTPPGGSGGGSGAGQAYAPPPPTYASQEQGYAAPDQGYSAADQGYAAQDPAYQSYQQGYQGYGAPPPQGQGAQLPPPQWNSAPGTGQQGTGQQGMARPGRPARQPGERGLIGSLFDFSFTSMVTPKIIRALYVLFTIWTILAAVGILYFFSSNGGFSGFVGGLVVDVIFVPLSMGIYRIILEAFMVIFQIHGELKTIRAQGEEKS
jgi:hypothetical protein